MRASATGAAAPDPLEKTMSATATAPYEPLRAGAATATSLWNDSADLEELRRSIAFGAGLVGPLNSAIPGRSTCLDDTRLAPGPPVRQGSSRHGFRKITVKEVHKPWRSSYAARRRRRMTKPMTSATAR